MNFKSYLDYDWKLEEFIVGVKTSNEVVKGLKDIVPRGRDWRSEELFLNKIYDTTKNKLCYCNFSLNTNLKRELIYKRLKNRNFIEFGHMGEWQSYTGEHLWPEKKRLENLEVDLKCRDDFYKKLAQSKFTISPEGYNIDTFRTWDALYLKTIPIVEDSSWMRNFKELPILFTKDYSEITEEYLNDKWDEFLNTEFNFELLKKSNWIDKEVEKYIQI